LLEDCGYTVTPFVNGRLALDEFAANPDDYDLVITDMTMPKMTGDVMAQQMLAIRPELPVALCTGYSDRISESSALEMGIDKFFQKPVNSRELTAYIKQTLAPQG
jgi:CheY-like chemotaxis protein